MFEFLTLAIVLSSIWYWWESMQCKEIARQAGSRTCHRADVQFLDDSVVLKKVWLRRNASGRLQLCRLFFFEFSSNGAQRYHGRIVLLGHRVQEVEMDAYRIDE